MNRRKFLRGAAIAPVAIAVPAISIAKEEAQVQDTLLTIKGLEVDDYIELVVDNEYLSRGCFPGAPSEPNGERTLHIPAKYVGKQILITVLSRDNHPFTINVTVDRRRESTVGVMRTSYILPEIILPSTSGSGEDIILKQMIDQEAWDRNIVEYERTVAEMMIA